MLKKICFVWLVVILSACASAPRDDSFSGTGEFDEVEAAKTRVSLGLTYLKNGNFSQAKFNLDKALEFAPRLGEAHYAMAFYYQQVDEQARAEEYYQSALDYSKNDPDVLNSYGAFLCKQGKYNKAKKYFLEAVDDKSYISAASTYENLALCSQSQGNINEAIEYFSNALNHQPTRSSTLIALAQIYTDKQQWTDAKRALWKYERNASVSAESLWLSFQIAQGQNDMKAAADYVDILRRLYPTDVNTQKAVDSLGKFKPGLMVTRKNPSDPSYPNQTAINEPSKKSRVILPEQISQSQSTSNFRSQPSNAQTSLNNTNLADMSASEATQALAQQVQSGENVSDINLNTSTTNTISTPNNSVSSNSITENSRFHIVKPKENLYRISLKYNVKVNQLMEWNNFLDASSIPIGTKLWVRDPNLNE